VVGYYIKNRRRGSGAEHAILSSRERQ